MHKKEQLLSVHPIEPGGEYIISGIRDIPAGFPNISQDYLADPIDLIKELIQHPDATHYARIRGDSMKDAGLEKDDILLVDGVKEYENGAMAVCVVDGEFTIKYLNTSQLKEGIIWLMPDNPDYPPIKVTEDQEFTILGTVIKVIKTPKKKHFTNDSIG